MTDFAMTDVSDSLAAQYGAASDGIQVDMKEGQGPKAGLLDLPPEVVVQVYHQLTMTDRLSLLRVCKSFHGIYTESATLAYDFALRTSAYLDVTFEPTADGVPVPAGSPKSIAIAPTSSDPQVRGRGRSNADPPSVSFPLPFDPPLSERQHVPAKRGLGAAEKAAMLSRRETAWDTLDARAERSFTIRGPAGVYELQEGVFLMCDEYSDTDDGKPSTIRLIPLASAEDPDLDNPPLPLKTVRLPFSIADLTMDPTQDLIIVSEHRPAALTVHDASARPTHRYHLLTLSTFAPHPLAAVPTLDFPPYHHSIMSSRQLLQVMGDVLVILVSRYLAHWLVAGLGMGMPFINNGNEEEVVCWNWKTGKVLSRMSLPENGWFASIALLTPTTFMVTSTANISQLMATESRTIASVFPPVIQIYSFSPDPAHPINPVQPLGAEFNDDTTPRPVLLAQLDLPRFTPGASVATFDVRPDPAFPPRQPEGDARGIGSSKPFTQDPQKGVLVFDLQISEPADGPEGGERVEAVCYELFVLRETLVQLATEGEERLRQARAEGGSDGFERWQVEKTFRWEDWGVTSARLMNASMLRRNWVCSCSGYRFISLIPSDDLPTMAHEQQHDLIPGPPRRSDLRVLDFSPYAVQREISRSRPDTTAQSWDTLQDIPTSSAPIPLRNSDIKSLLQDMNQWHAGLDDPDRRDRVFDQFRRQYERMFYSASNRARSDRADRERGRGRAGGTRSDSNSRSRSRSQHNHPHRHHRPAHGGSHSRTRQTDYSPSPARPPMPSGSGSGSGSGDIETRGRSRSSRRSVSPTSIFTRVAKPINMAGPDDEMLDDDEEDEEKEYEARVVSAPTVLEARKVWREDVVSALPFREVWRKKEMRANGVMMDDQRVIVVCTDGKRNGDWSKIQQTMTVLCM